MVYMGKVRNCRNCTSPRTCNSSRKGMVHSTLIQLSERIKVSEDEVATDSAENFASHEL